MQLFKVRSKKYTNTYSLVLAESKEKALEMSRSYFEEYVLNSFADPKTRAQFLSELDALPVLTDLTKPFASCIIHGAI